MILTMMIDSCIISFYCARYHFVFAGWRRRKERKGKIEKIRFFQFVSICVLPADGIDNGIHFAGAGWEEHEGKHIGGLRDSICLISSCLFVLFVRIFCFFFFVFF